MDGTPEGARTGPLPRSPLRLLGLDPGLRHTGWGIVDVAGNRLSHVADGAVHSDDALPLAERLRQLHDALVEVLERYRPDEAAVEETFVNKNAASTLKLGQARAVALLVPALAGLPVAEYPTNLVKKSVVGAGHADKTQIQMMVRVLLPGCELFSADAADALAVAICHAHHRQTRMAWRAYDPLPSGERVAAQPPGEGSSRRSGGTALPSPRPSPRGGEGDLREQAKRLPTQAETARARRLRRDSTDAEKLLWQRLRAGQMGVKFRRQESILGYTVDFVAHERRLVVELDGGQHAERQEEDARRSRRLEQAGFKVVRFWNNEVLENPDEVLETILRHLDTSLRPPSGRGEGDPS